MQFVIRRRWFLLASFGVPIFLFVFLVCTIQIMIATFWLCNRFYIILYFWIVQSNSTKPHQKGKPRRGAAALRGQKAIFVRTKRSGGFKARAGFAFCYQKVPKCHILPPCPPNYYQQGVFYDRS